MELSNILASRESSVKPGNTVGNLALSDHETKKQHREFAAQNITFTGNFINLRS